MRADEFTVDADHYANLYLIHTPCGATVAEWDCGSSKTPVITLGRLAGLVDQHYESCETR